MRVSMGWRYLRRTVNMSAFVCLTVNNFFRLTDIRRKKQFFLKNFKSFYHGKPLKTLQNGNKKGWNTGSISHETRPREGTNSTKQYYVAESASGKDEAHSVFWLATRAGKMSPACLFGISRLRPARTILLLTKLVRSRWLDIGLVHFCVVSDLEFVLVHQTQKRNWSITHIYWQSLQIVVRKIYMANSFITTTGF